MHDITPARRRRVAAALSTTALSALILAGCAGGATGATDTPTELKVGNVELTSWDPADDNPAGNDNPYLSAVYDPLVALDPNGAAIPALATDWTLSDDRLALTMNLRTDAEFTSGAPVDADAVVAGVNHLREGSGTGFTFSSVSGVTAVDADTIEFAFTAPEPAFLYLLGIGASYIVDPAALAGGSLATKPVGSGPYQLDEAATVAGSEYHFTKRADHWDTKTYPWEKVSMLSISDDSARLNAMLSGQINVNWVRPAQVAQAEQMGWSLATIPNAWVGLQLVDRTGDMLAPLGDVRVRQALNMAFDREAILQAVEAGQGTVTNQVFVAEGAINDPALESAYPYDVAGAKALLAEAGYPDGFSVTMPMTLYMEPYQAVVTQSLADIGVTVTWDSMSFPEFLQKATSYPMFPWGTVTDADPFATVNRQLTTPIWFNTRLDYANTPELSAIVDEIGASSGEAQVEAVRKLNAALVDLAWWVPWFQTDLILGSAPGITVTPLSGTGYPPLRNIQPS